MSSRPSNHSQLYSKLNSQQLTWIGSADEAHHVTTHMLGATGKRHNHEEVHEIRRAFHGMREEHEVCPAVSAVYQC